MAMSQGTRPPPTAAAASALDDAVARAEAALRSLSGEFAGWMEDELGRTEAAHQRLLAEGPGPEPLEALYARAHDLKGMAGACGHPLTTRAADSLCRLLGGGPERTPPSAEVVQLHMQALRTLTELGATDEAHPVGVALCEELERRVGAVRPGATREGLAR